MTEEQINSNNGSYSAENIQVLEGLEAVRKRPAMYIGDISTKGLHHLVYEVVDNSIDEALAGYCDHIDVTINEDNSITVQDNGRGIPVDFHEKEQKSALEVVMTVLHAGGKFDKGSYKVSGGLHGVGVSCVNALSTHMTTQVFRNGKIYQQEYECGHPLYPVKEIGTSDITGTRQQFWPDNTIFTETVYNYEILATRMRELAYLNAGIKITLTDLRVKDEENNTKMEVFYSEEGLKEFVRYIDSSREHLVNDVIYINTEKQGTPVEVAFRQEIKPGPAVIRSSISGELREYTVQIQEVRASGGGFQNYLGQTYDPAAKTWTETYGQQVGVTFALTLYSPRQAGEAGCRALADQVAAAFLTGGPAGFAVEKWTLGEAAFDAQWGMFRVKLQAHCRGWLVARTQESGEIVGFAVKGEVVL